MSTLTDARWEEMMKERGLERERRAYEKRAKAGNHAEAPAGKDLVQKVIDDLGNAIAEDLVMAEAKRGVKPQLLVLAGHLNPFVLAFLTLRVAINQSLINSSMIAAGRRCGRAIEAEARAMWMVEKDPGRFGAITKTLASRSSTDEAHLDKVLKANLHEFGEGAPSWSDRDAKLVGLRLLDLCITKTGLVRAEQRAGSLKMRGQLALFPAEGMAAWLDHRTDMRGLLRPAYAPKLAPPVPWESPTGGGYTSLAGRPLSLVTRCRPAQKAALEQADLSRVYKSLNILQNVRWAINARVLGIIQKMWDRDMALAGLPNRENKKPSPYPEGADETTIKAWKRETAILHTNNAVSLSGRLELARILDTAGALTQQSELYFPHRCDFRGRVYAVPEGLSPQGGDVSKSLLLFAEAETPGEDGERWLKIHGANTFGVDKVSFDERVSWADEHEARALAIAADPLRDLWWTEADSPFQFLAWCFEMDRVRNIDGKSSLPIALDGSCNGLQHFSAMLRDPVGGAAVNLLPSETPQDVYQAVADRVMERLRVKALEGDWVARGWLDFGVTRKITKRPVMVLPYGGTIMSCVQYVREGVMERIKGGAENPFGDEVGGKAGALATEVWGGIGEVVVAAREAMGWLQKVGRGLSKAGKNPTWVSPSGFPVVQTYTKDSLGYLKTALGGKSVQLVDWKPTGLLNPSRNALAISPNFVHSLDAAALVATILRFEEDGGGPLAMIHDSYGTLASRTTRLSRNLREAFVEMYQTNPLETLFEQVREDLPDLDPPPESGSLDINQVLESKYFFA